MNFNGRYFINRCPGRITTVGENVISKSEHSHAADVRKSEQRIGMATIRQAAKNSNSPPRRIIRAVTATMSKEAAIGLPMYDVIARNVRRVRNKAKVIPKQPETLSDLVIDGEYAQTMKGEMFLLYDNKHAVNRIVIFATKDNLQFMVACDDWYMDGTFDITPPLFKQVYTVHGNNL